MAAPPLWYFAYGSNLDPATFGGRRGMRPLATRLGRLEGYRLCFDIPIGPGERGVANVAPQPGALVCGVLYALAAEDAVILDRTEGVHLGVYRRAPVEVVADGDERVAAFTYRSERSVPGRKPSARYMKLLLEGAHHHGLPADYRRFLESIELAWDERVRHHDWGPDDG